MANKEQVLILRIDDDLKARLQSTAKLQEVSMSEVVRRLIASLPLAGTISDWKIEWKGER